MTTYTISAAPTRDGVLLTLAFGEPAQNDRIVRDAVSALSALENELAGGGTAYLNGPASLPVAVAIAHAIAHRFREVAVFDPKMAAYVVAVSHGGRQVGDLIPADDVVEAAPQTTD